MMTLEQGIREYLVLRRPQFCKANPHVPMILSAAAVSLASRMWVDGTDLIPSVWYIALVGPPRTGKSAILRTMTRLFDRTGVHKIATGSPEAMLKDIEAKRHGYIRFDELGYLVKLLNSYMGPLVNILNSAYYLEELSQTRVDNKKSVIVPAEDYFIHVYMSGVPDDWAMLERKATGGFVRRTLVIPVRGHIPFFIKAHKDKAVLNYIAQLKSRIARILDAMRYLELTVYLPEFPELGEVLEKTQLDLEKKSMVEEYFYKLLAGRIVANLITFDPSEDPSVFDTNEIVHRMLKNAERLGVEVEVLSSTSTKVTIDITLPEQEPIDTNVSKTMRLDGFMPPHFTSLTFNQLLETVKPQEVAPDSITLKNVELIRNWLDSGGPAVVTKSTFIKRILHTTNPTYYKAVLEVLEDAGYIKTVNYPKGRRMVQYIVLDPKARVCANCLYFRDPEKCPRLRGAIDEEDIIRAVPPWSAPCEKFRLADEEEEE